ncbi:caspase family protein [Methylorubrum aminovorans]
MSLRTLLALVVSLVLTVAAERALAAPVERRVALVIGNAAYQRFPSLPNPRNDAEDVIAALKRAGFEVFGGTDLRRETIREHLRQFARAAQGADAALAYYAGHGLQYKGRNYIVPVDAKLQDEFDLEYETVRIDDVVGELNRADGARILILDACRNLPLKEKSERNPFIDTGLAKISGRGLVVAYATQANALAFDGTGRNSIFTDAFLKTIAEPGLDLPQFFQQVSIVVDRQSGGRQTPELSLSYPGQFYFNRSETDRDVWRKIRDSNDPALMRAFVRKFPQSDLADAANARLAKLEDWNVLKEEQARRAEAVRQRKQLEEQARLAEEMRQKKLAEEREAEARRLADQARLAEETRQKRLAEEREAETRRVAEQARLADEAREAARQKKLAEQREAEARRLADQARLAEETRQKRLAEEREAETRRVAEQARLADEAREAARQKKLAEQREAEARRLADQARLAEETRQKRLAEEREAETRRVAEQARLAEEARQKKLAAEQAAEARRLAEESSLAEIARQKKLTEEKVAEAQRLAEERLAEERRQAELTAQEERRKRLALEEAAERLRAERAAADALQRRLAEERVEQERRVAGAEQDEAAKTSTSAAGPDVATAPVSAVRGEPDRPVGRLARLDTSTLSLPLGESRMAYSDPQALPPATKAPVDGFPSETILRDRLNRDTEAELGRIGCTTQGADTNWNDASRRALARFARQAKLKLDPVEPTADLLEDLKSRPAHFCPLECGTGQKAEGDHCVAATKPKPEPEPKPVARKPKPEPEPKPVARKPKPEPEPKPVARKPKPEPEPKPVARKPKPEPREAAQPKTRPAPVSAPPQAPVSTAARPMQRPLMGVGF